MVQRDHRLDAVGQQTVDQLVVVVLAVLADLVREPIGDQARPGYGESGGRVGL